MQAAFKMLACVFSDAIANFVPRVPVSGGSDDPSHSEHRAP